MGSRGSIAANLFAEEDKGKAGMGSYRCVGPFFLALDPSYGLTGNFSFFITCFEAISYSLFPFDASPTFGQALIIGFCDSIRSSCIGSPSVVTLLPPLSS
jgi:hypothetical protein